MAGNTTDVQVFDGTKWVSIAGTDGINGTPGSPGKSISGVSLNTTTVEPDPCGEEVDATGTASTVPDGSGNLTLNLDLGIPRGPCGADGSNGTAATAEVGTVSTNTLPEGQNASVTVNDQTLGDTSKLTLGFDFKIPKGDKGDGITIKDSVDNEAQLPACDAAGLTVGDMYIVAVNNAGEKGHGFVYNGPDSNPCFTDIGQIKGQDGSNGTTPNIQVGNVTSSPLACDASPTALVQRTGTDANPIFDFAFGAVPGCDGSNGTDGKSATITLETNVPMTDRCNQTATGAFTKTGGTANDPTYKLTLGVPHVKVTKSGTEPSASDRCLGDFWIVTD